MLNIFKKKELEKEWMERIQTVGWVSEPRVENAANFSDWGHKWGWEALDVEGRTEVMWARRWFNPKLARWGEKFSFLPSFSVPRSRIEMVNELKHKTGFDGPLLPDAIINMWLDIELLLQDDDNLTLSPTYVKDTVDVEEAFKSTGGIMAEAELDAMYGEHANLLRRDSRINLHGVILDLEYLRIDASWLFRLTENERHNFDTLDLSDYEPLKLSRFGHLDDDQRVDIVKAVFEHLSKSIEGSGISINNALIHVGNREQIRLALIETLVTSEKTVSELIDQDKASILKEQTVRKEIEFDIRMKGVENEELRQNGRLLTLRGLVLQRAEAEAEAMFDEEYSQS